MHRALSASLAGLALVGGCQPTWNWSVGECDEEEREHIGFAVEQAVLVQATTDAYLAERYGDERPSFAEVIEHLVGIHEADRILCGYYDEEGEGFDSGGPVHVGAADHDGFIYVNTGIAAWDEALEGWQAGAFYAELSEAEIMERLEPMALEDLHAFEREIRGYLYGSSRAAGILVHEAAHLATDLEHTAEFEDFEAYSDQTDYVFDTGWFTRSAIYWEVWRPEADWLWETYLALHPPDEAASGGLLDRPVEVGPGHRGRDSADLVSVP